MPIYCGPDRFAPRNWVYVGKECYQPRTPMWFWEV
jgi:hypothetical protein